ncbi:MAG: DoxX family protein [Phycisphaeraceae bacterium]
MLLNRRPILNDLALLLLRLIVGAVFIFHGSQKLFGWFDGPGIEGFAGFLEQMEIPEPMVMAWVTAISEFAGGILVLLGLLTRLAAIAPLIVMIVAIVTVHPDAFAVDKGGMEFALTLATILTALILAGPGRISIDGIVAGGKREEHTGRTTTRTTPPPSPDNPPPPTA